MPASVIDSAVFRDVFGSKAMRRVWDVRRGAAQACR
jgi:hypothetical protein